MKKLAICCAFFSILICYLEWAGGNSAFIYEAEYQILFQNKSKVDSFTHPIVLIPFCGQLLLLFSLFQKTPDRRLVFTGLSLMGILMLLIMLVGLLSMNGKIVGFTLPFLFSAVWCLRVFNQKSHG